MNAKERSTAFLSGLPTDRFPFHPLVMQFAALKAGVPYSRCCLEHEQQCRVMLDCADRFGLDYVRAAAEGLDASEEDLRFICFSYQSMFVGMLLDWLRRGMKGEPVDFLERAQRLMLGNTRRMLEANAENQAAGQAERAES